MTREEALDLLNKFEFCCDFSECTNEWECEECGEALDMAIEALEQGPSCRNTRQVDLISRQAAIDAIAKFVPYAICDESTESYTNGLMDAYNLICQLPSAQLRGMSKYIKLEDAIHAIAENMAQEANLKEHCNEPTFCAGEFLVEAEMSVKDLPTIEVSNDCISKDVMHDIDTAIEALEQPTVQTIQDSCITIHGVSDKYLEDKHDGKILVYTEKGCRTYHSETEDDTGIHSRCVIDKLHRLAEDAENAEVRKGILQAIEVMKGED